MLLPRGRALRRVDNGVDSLRQRAKVGVAGIGKHIVRVADLVVGNVRR